MLAMVVAEGDSARQRTDVREVEDDSVPKALVLGDVLVLVEVGSIHAEDDLGSSITDGLDVGHEVGVLLLGGGLRVEGGCDEKLGGDNGRGLDEE